MILLLSKNDPDQSTQTHRQHSLPFIQKSLMESFGSFNNGCRWKCWARCSDNQHPLISHWPLIAMHKSFDDGFSECCWEMSHQHSVLSHWPIAEIFWKMVTENVSSAFCTIRHPLIDQSLTHWWCSPSIVGPASDTDTRIMSFCKCQRN